MLRKGVWDFTAMLNFEEHLKTVFDKVNIAIGLHCKLSDSLNQSKSTLKKSFMRLHLDCRDIMYDQLNNKWFQSKIESIQ